MAILGVNVIKKKYFSQYTRLVTNTERKEAMHNTLSLVTGVFTRPNLVPDSLTEGQKQFLKGVHFHIVEALVQSFLDRHTSLRFCALRERFLFAGRAQYAIKVKGKHPRKEVDSVFSVTLEIPSLLSPSPWYDQSFIRPGLGYWRFFILDRNNDLVVAFYHELYQLFLPWLEEEEV